MAEKTQVVATDLSALRKASQDERKQMVQEGKVRAPRRGTPERQEFDKLLFDASHASPVSDPVEKSVEATIDTSVVSPTPPAAPEAKETSKPAEKPVEIKKYGDFESVDDLLADYERKKSTEAQLKSLTDEQQRLIAKLHATASDQGRVIASKNKELEETKKTKEGSTKPAEANQAVDVGDPPDPMQYDDGILGEKYQKDLVDWQKRLAASFKAAPAVSSIPEIEELKKKVEQAEAFAIEERTRKSQERVMKEWSNVWSEVSDFQKKYGCQTSVPFETINNMLLIRDNTQASLDERDMARKFLDGLSQVDKDNADKVLPAVTSMFAVENGVPKKRYKVFEAALVDNGLIDKFNPQSQSQAAAIKRAEADKLKKNATDNSVSALSVSSQPGTREPLTQGTADEKMERLRELAAKRASDPSAFKADSAQWKEFSELRAEFGAAMPRR